MKSKPLIRHVRIYGVIFTALFLLSVAFIGTQTPSASAQDNNGFAGAIFDVVPPTPLSSVISGTAGTFVIEAPVFLGRTIIGTTCVSPSDLFSMEGGPRVGTLRIWGQSLGRVIGGGGDGDGTDEGPDEGPTNITNGALAVVNASLELRSFSGSIEMQGTLGEVFQIIVETLGSTEGQIGPIIDKLAITGGTGTFRGASGEATITPLIGPNNANCPNGAFRLTIQSVRRGPSIFIR